jgi:glycosyltransferase involved in cell wall biosynthesis
MHPPNILAFSSWFLPGFKAGGPIRTLVNIIQHLEQDFCFKVVTRDRDLGDDAPFAGIRNTTWTKTGTTMVKYLGSGERSPWGLRNIIRESYPDILYLNSFFDPALSIMPLLLSRMGMLTPRNIPVVIAPRGEFASSALSIKSWKKRLFLKIARMSGLCNGVIWQAGSEYERLDIRTVWGGDADVVIAPDLPPRLETSCTLPERRNKTAGTLRAVFLSRLAAMKNLDGALKMLSSSNVVTEFDIYGPSEDEDYWNTCQEMIARLPANIQVRYLGPVANSEVEKIYARYDLLFLPTLGESFGHVILEALLAGCPVLISDRTPWQRLEEKEAGWVVSLDDPGRFLDILHRVARMDSAEHMQWSHGARRCGVEFSCDMALVDASRNLFNYALEKTY